MKMLGVDYGLKRVGIAMTDQSGFFAMPHSVLDNNNKLIGEIVKICRENNIGKIIVGLSLNYKMEPNFLMENINNFVKRLSQKTGTEIVLENETLTTAEAARIQGNTVQIDASSAALILKSYIDRHEKVN